MGDIKSLQMRLICYEHVSPKYLGNSSGKNCILRDASGQAISVSRMISIGLHAIGLGGTRCGLASTKPGTPI